MNAAARALAEGAFTTGNVRTMAFSPRNRLLLLVVLALLLTGFAVIYVKDLNRQLFYDYQKLEQTRDNLNVEWGQLLLEQNTWATQARIQQVAEQNLTMAIPSPQTTVIVKL